MLAGSQAPTKAALPLLSAAGQGGQNLTKGSWVEIQTRRHCSSNTITGKTVSTWEYKLNYFITNKEQDNENKSLRMPSCHPSLLPQWCKDTDRARRLSSVHHLRLLPLLSERSLSPLHHGIPPTGDTSL